MEAPVQTKHEHSNAPRESSQRTNDVIARSAIPNRHRRRPALHSDATIDDLSAGTRINTNPRNK